MPREAPALSPSDILPSPAAEAEQPVKVPVLHCPAWPGCRAEFQDEKAQKHHIQRHAHAQRAMVR